MYVNYSMVLNHYIFCNIPLRFNLICITSESKAASSKFLWGHPFAISRWLLILLSPVNLESGDCYWDM